MKKTLTHFIIALVASTFSFESVKAQLTSTGGPTGEGNVHALLAWNDTAFAGVNAHCLRTLDGVHWQQLTNGLGASAENINPYCFSRLGNTIYMGTNNGSRVYRSTDLGDTWIPYADSLLTPVPLMSVTSGNKVFMAGTNFNLCYTTLANDGWKTTGLGGYPYCLKVLGPDTLWTSMGGKIWATHNNGATWMEINHGPMYNPSGFVKLNSGRIIATTDAGGVNNVYFTDNYGGTWTLATTGFAIGKQIVKINDNKIVALAYGGLYKTVDQGVNWTLVSSIAGQYAQLWKNNELLVGTSSGLFAMPDPAVSTANLVEMPYANVKGMVTLNNKLFALTSRGLFSRAISGGAWSMVSVLTGYYTSAVNNLRLYNSKLYLMTDKGAFTSTDEGLTFTAIAGLQNRSITDYFISENIHIAPKKTFYIFYEYTDSVFYSSDAGATWAKTALTGFPAYPGNFSAYHITQHNSKLFLSGSNGYGTSTDNGATWTHTPTTMFAYYIGNRIYSFDGVLIKEKFDSQGGGTRAIEKSTDNGLTWVSDTVGLPINTVFNWPYTAGVFMSDGKLYTYADKPGAEGMFSKSSATANWLKILNTGKLPSIPTHVVASGSDVFVGLRDNAVWYTSGSTGIRNNDLVVKHGDIIVYPNPAKDLITIQTTPKDISSSSLISIYDSQGKLVLQQLLKQEKTDLDISRLPKGIYILKLNSNDRMSSTRFVKE